jgi:hypothetical protein
LQDEWSAAILLITIGLALDDPASIPELSDFQEQKQREVVSFSVFETEQHEFGGFSF